MFRIRVCVMYPIGKYTVIQATLRWVRILHKKLSHVPDLVSKCSVNSAVLVQHSVF